MGFYTKHHYVQVPNKRLIDDVLTRNGEATEESFTPFIGRRYLIEKQLLGMYENLSLEVILSSIEQDMNIGRINERDIGIMDDSGVQMDNNYSLLNLTEFKELEKDEGENLVELHCNRVLIGIKRNSKSFGNIVACDIEYNSQPTIYDEESNEIYNISDGIMDEEVDIDHIVEEQEIKSRVVYLIKRLQEGSVRCGISLLSLVICRDYILTHYGYKEEDVKLIDLFMDSLKVYSVFENGTLDRVIPVQTRHDNKKLDPAFKIMFGRTNKNNVYYKAGIELTNLARKLGFKMKDEDVSNYEPLIVNNLVCDYVMSNREVLEQLGYVDPKILNMFDSGSLFSSSTPSSNNKKMMDYEDTSTMLRKMARDKMSRVSELDEYILGMLKVEGNIRQASKYISRFLKAYHEKNPTTFITQKSSSDCTIMNNVLCDGSGLPLIFNLNGFIEGWDPTPKTKSPYGLISQYGYVIHLDEFKDKFFVSEVSHLVNYYIGEYSGRAMWKTEVTL